MLVGGPSGAGGPRAVRDLHDLVDGEGLGDAVTFLGPRHHDELPWVYSAADVVLMPSRSEAFGLTALEAQACGVPVIAARVGGLPEVLGEGAGGVLIPGHDPARYAEAILGLLGGSPVPYATRRGQRRAVRLGADGRRHPRGLRRARRRPRAGRRFLKPGVSGRIGGALQRVRQETNRADLRKRS